MRRLLMFSLIVVLAFMMISCSATANNDTENSTKNIQTADVSNNQNATVLTPEPEKVEVAIKDVELTIGENIPNFKFETLEGDEISLDDYLGKIIMLNFWTTWCSYCVEEMPDLEEMDREEDVVVLALNSGENRTTITKFIEENNLDLIILMDEDSYYSEKFYVTSLPTTYFINEEGILLGSIPGMITKEQMETIIQDIRDNVL